MVGHEDTVRCIQVCMLSIENFRGTCVIFCIIAREIKLFIVTIKLPIERTSQTDNVYLKEESICEKNIYLEQHQLIHRKFISIALRNVLLSGDMSKPMIKVHRKLFLFQSQQAKLFLYFFSAQNAKKKCCIA